MREIILGLGIGHQENIFFLFFLIFFTYLPKIVFFFFFFGGVTWEYFFLKSLFSLI